MSFNIPAKLEAELDRLAARYPQKRSASLMFLHALQEHFGWLPREAIEWAARKLGLQPIHLHELATFYPMFRLEPAGRVQFKVCRTLSCALGGSHELHAHLCRRLGLDPHRHGVQTTPDGQFSLEFVECLAGCGAAPVMMVNEEFLEAVTPAEADAILEQGRP